ncbi:hypothetical protein Tco_1138561, partial [Tanacetum coccineum]
IMGEPLSPNHVFDFLVDEPKPHPAYDFFAPRPLPGYSGNPNNNNGWLEADDYLLGELEAMVDEPMVVPAIEEEDLVALFGDDDFEDDASDGFDEEEVWEVNKEWLMAPTIPPLMLAVPLPSVYEVGGPSTAAAEGSSFPHSASRLFVSDAEVAAGVSIREIGLRVFAVKGQTAAQRDEAVAELTQRVQALQAAVQQRDMQILQLQTTVSEMGSRESTLIWCILGLEMRLEELERRPPRPQ